MIELAALLALALGLAALLPRRGGPTLGYLRSLAPTWRFFETVDVVPVLEAVACGPDGVERGGWVEVLEVARHGPLAAFWNAEHNLRLAESAVVESLLEELDGCPEDRVETLVAHRLARRLVERRLEGASHYRFRVLATEGEAEEEVYRSPLLARSPA